MQALNRKWQEYTTQGTESIQSPGSCCGLLERKFTFERNYFSVMAPGMTTVGFWHLPLDTEDGDNTLIFQRITRPLYVVASAWQQRSEERYVIALYFTGHVPIKQSWKRIQIVAFAALAQETRQNANVRSKLVLQHRTSRGHWNSRCTDRPGCLTVTVHHTQLTFLSAQLKRIHLSRWHECP